ncbi:MAG TPA: XrtA/PEP-CTERM system histidine kinase PrsK [Vicinamibacterales bacterium]|nr:XrtA/PEP-CTERM system histidine kinase PrsK [Vicinamibacterales bacterium]
MNLFFLLPFAAGSASLLLAAVSLLRGRPTVAGWLFVAGMTALGLDSLFMGFSLRAAQSGDVVAWLTPAFLAESFTPVLWLGFALTYSRSNYAEFLTRWKPILAVLGVFPLVVLTAFFVQRSSGAPTDLWWLRPAPQTMVVNLVLLAALVLILVNLEQTFRATVGTMRWQIKLVVVGLAVVFGARLYVRSQAILFSAPDVAFWSLESSALLIGCMFLAVAYARTGLAEIDVYPSLAVLRSSLTVVVVGAYLLVVGVLAQVVARFGGAEIFQFQAVVVILGMAGLAVLLLSDRARQRLHAFGVRHFSKAQHDSVRIWTLFAKRLSTVADQTGVCAAAAKLVSETFDVLSVTVWLEDDGTGGLAVAASTARRTAGADESSRDVLAGLQDVRSPLDLDHAREPWAEEFRRVNPTTFPAGGNRICVPLRAGERVVGALVLADRVNAAIYTIEDLELLQCIGDHITSILMNLRLANEVARSRELDAFRLMSTFFVHDLKNAAASLNLTLKNLPVHFDDPAFRKDALRTIGNTAQRIDDMIARLSALRQAPETARIDADLNQLVDEALDKVTDLADITVTKELRPLPRIVADRDQIQSVVTNLVLNARDAVGHDGTIHVRTDSQGQRVLLSVVDNGCGMSDTFVKQSLFRPFQSTKKKGLGIGLFQCRAIVQAHGGGIHVESEVGKGTTFLVSFPAKDGS